MSFFVISEAESQLYEEAIEIMIDDSSKEDQIHCFCKKNFTIMKEVVDFESISFLFKDEIKEHSKGTIKDQVIEVSDSRIELGRKKSKFKIYLTNVRNGIFFAQQFCDGKKSNTTYDDISLFGQSQAYMFKVMPSGQVTLVKVKRLSHN